MITKKFLTEEVLNEIRSTVGRFPAETGGILGTSAFSSTIVSTESQEISIEKRGDKKIDLFCFDKWAKTSGGTFYYDVEKMSEVFNHWQEEGSSLVGVIHSHPRGYIQPSYHDISTALLHMDFLETDVFYMPIVQADKDGFFKLYFYTVKKDEKKKNVITSLDFVVYAGKEGSYDFFENVFFNDIKTEIHSIEELNFYRKSLEYYESEINNSKEVEEYGCFCSVK